MNAFLSLVLIGSQLLGSSGVVWTKGFSSHHSQSLPSGLVLLVEDGFYSQGSRDIVRLTWFRKESSTYKKVLAFQGTATLEDLPPKIDGNSVRLRTVDEPRAFLVSAADNTLGRDRTWLVQHGTPHMVMNKPRSIPLRMVDEAVSSALSASHPTVLQKQIRKVWSERIDLESWTDTRTRTTWTVKVNHNFTFIFRRSGADEWQLNDFRTGH